MGWESIHISICFMWVNRTWKSNICLEENKCILEDDQRSGRDKMLEYKLTKARQDKYTYN